MCVCVCVRVRVRVRVCVCVRVRVCVCVFPSRVTEKGHTLVLIVEVHHSVHTYVYVQYLCTLRHPGYNNQLPMCNHTYIHIYIHMQMNIIRMYISIPTVYTVHNWLFLSNLLASDNGKSKLLFPSGAPWSAAHFAELVCL